MRCAHRLDLSVDRVASLPLVALSFVDMSGLWRYPEELQTLLNVIMGHFDHSYLTVCCVFVPKHSV